MTAWGACRIENSRLYLSSNVCFMRKMYRHRVSSMFFYEENVPPPGVILRPPKDLVFLRVLAVMHSPRRCEAAKHSQYKILRKPPDENIDCLYTSSIMNGWGNRKEP